MKKEITVVIPCKNEESYIGILLESICKQDFGSERLKIFVADAGSTDKTLDVVKSFAEKIDIEIINGGLPAVGRNNGAKLASTKYVLFIDADIELSRKGLIRKSFELAERKSLECLTANILCKNSRIIDFIIYALNNIGQYLSMVIGKPFATGMYMFFEREKFLKLGGFDEKVLYAEDFFLSKQVSSKKFGVVFDYFLATNRRFKKMGYLKIIRMFLSTFFHSNNKEFFYKDKGYWN